jgi:UDP-glucose 4-epimerase
VAQADACAILGGDVIKIYADSALAKKELGWKAKKSLADMVTSAWKWEQYLTSIKLPQY